MTAKAADRGAVGAGQQFRRDPGPHHGGAHGRFDAPVVHKGKIKLLAQGGTANVSGKLDASAPKGGDGGFIETTGDKVKIADNAVITTKAASGRAAPG